MSQKSLTPREARQQLHEIMDSDASLEEKTQTTLDLGCEYLGADTGYVSQIDQQTNQYRVDISTDSGDEWIPPGLEANLETTFCRHTIEEESLALHDTSETGDRDTPPPEDFGIHCYHGTTLHLDGEVYGTVCFSAQTAREEPFTDGETMFAELLTRLIERELERNRHKAELTRQVNLANVLNRVLRHNLRNEMAVIRGSVDYLLDEIEDPRQAEIALERIDTLLELGGKARQLEQIIGTESEREQQNISALLEAQIQTVAEQFPAASLTAEIDDDLTATVLPSFERAIQEILENAAKHSGNEPAVRITAENVPNAIEIEISDNGPGLADQERQVLETGAETPLTHGSGLGLWVAHWIVSSNGGSIAATVTDDGTRMMITVPRTPETDDQERVAELKRARDQYQAAFQEAFDAMVIINNDGRILAANPPAGEIYGMEHRQLLGHSLNEFLPDSFDFAEALQRVKSTGSEFDTETILGADGTERVVEYSATTDIVPGQHLIISRNITDRKERKQQLQETAELLDATIQASPDPIIVIDAEGVVQLWNDAAEDVFHYPAAEVVGESMESLSLHGEDSQSEFRHRLAQAFEGETFTDLRVQRQTKEGEPLELSLSTANIHDANGDISGVVAVAKQITPKR